VTFATLGKLACGCVLTAFAVAIPGVAEWRLSGPYGGSARSIAIDAQNHNVLLAGARDSLLFRSDNGGQSWRLIPIPINTPGTFGAVAIDPKESGHFYACLDANESPDSGIYESKDGGDTWHQLAGTRGVRIESLTLFPGDPHIVAAGTGKGVYLSSDSG